MQRFRALKADGFPNYVLRGTNTMTFSQSFVVSRSAELTTKPVERSTELVAGRERSHFDKLSANGSGQWIRHRNYGPEYLAHTAPIGACLSVGAAEPPQPHRSL